MTTIEQTVTTYQAYLRTRPLVDLRLRLVAARKARRHYTASLISEAIEVPRG